MLLSRSILDSTAPTLQHEGLEMPTLDEAKAAITAHNPDLSPTLLELAAQRYMALSNEAAAPVAAPVTPPAPQMTEMETIVAQAEAESEARRTPVERAERALRNIPVPWMAKKESAPAPAAPKTPAEVAAWNDGFRDWARRPR
jgi:hypothetical protein